MADAYVGVFFLPPISCADNRKPTPAYFGGFVFTVLTVWRSWKIVNLHTGLCVLGFCLLHAQAVIAVAAHVIKNLSAHSCFQTGAGVEGDDCDFETICNVNDTCVPVALLKLRCSSCYRPVCDARRASFKGGKVSVARLTHFPDCPPLLRIACSIYTYTTDKCVCVHCVFVVGCIVLVNGQFPTWNLVFCWTGFALSVAIGRFGDVACFVITVRWRKWFGEMVIRWAPRGSPGSLTGRRDRCCPNQKCSLKVGVAETDAVLGGGCNYCWLAQTVSNRGVARAIRFLLISMLASPCDGYLRAMLRRLVNAVLTQKKKYVLHTIPC